MKKIILILPLAITIVISIFLLIFLLQKKDLTKPPSALLNESLPQLTLVNLLKLACTHNSDASHKEKLQIKFQSVAQ